MECLFFGSKGAKPAGFLLALALPKSTGDKWLKAFARALRQAVTIDPTESGVPSTKGTLT